MSKLSKIIKIAESFSKQFGESVEGFGYSTIVDMLKKELNSTPYTINTLYSELKDKLRHHGIKNEWLSIEIKKYSSEVKYSTFILDKSIERNSPADFYNECCKHIAKNASEFLRKEAPKKAKSDITL